jgi:predicted nucleic acid-binding protein
MKLLIDTNIILDILMKREPWVKSAAAVLLAVAGEKAEGFITANTFADLYYLLHKHLHDNNKTRQTLRELLMVVSILDVTGIDCEKAFDLPMNDYEDALLACCAKRHKVNYIITRNVRDFAGSPVKTATPKDILESL